MHLFTAESYSSVDGVPDLRTGNRLFDSLARPIFFPMIDDSHCERIHSSATAFHYLNNGYVGKESVA